jgi:DNA polymerase IV
VLRWLVLDLNSFFASCEQQEKPALRGKPVIVVPTMAETTCAIAASYPAKAFGIKTGTLVHEARRLCPEVLLVPAHHKLYVEYHHRILTAIDRHIPVEEVMSIDEVVACRLDSKQQNPAVAQKLALHIKRQIQSEVGECLTSSIGISANKLLAKMASNMQKPDGLTILLMEKLPGAILHLEIRAIPGIGPSMAERLRRAGVTDMATLWNTDAARLRMIWGGVAGAKMHELLHGADIAGPKTERSSISHQHVLAPEDRSIEGAAPLVRQLLVRAAQRLRDDGFYCRRLVVEVKPLGRDREILDGQAQLRRDAGHRNAAPCAAGHMAKGAKSETPARGRRPHRIGGPGEASAGSVRQAQERKARARHRRSEREVRERRAHVRRCRSRPDEQDRLPKGAEGEGVLTGTR